MTAISFQPFSPFAPVHRAVERVLEEEHVKHPDRPLNDERRRYSELFSKHVAVWMRQNLQRQVPGQLTVLKGEANVRTVLSAKRLDVAVLDLSDYLLLDFSIKTFNHKNEKGRYGKNYTGRFYELLGEGIVLRETYKWATLVALIFLPEDSTDQAHRTCFTDAVSCFSQIAAGAPQRLKAINFEHVFVGVHSADEVNFYDAAAAMSRADVQPLSQRLAPHEMVATCWNTVYQRSARIAEDNPGHDWLPIG